METPVELIVGLGNPGPNFDRTRHNAGADLVLELAKSYQVTMKHESKFFGDTAKISIDGRDVRLLIPTTFMNRSGQSVAALARFYQVPVEAILVVHDELDISPGAARFKKGGGHGGHNGLRDIVQSLGNNKSFARLRIGIGHPGDARQVADYVLKKASPTDQQLISNSIDDALRTLPLAVSGQWERAMTALHTVQQ
ncbi:aminoacyl-tRNA hydrolase [Porticoccaceae bacterium]|nr:aminoacyl-tRNA hydrolase [Porticoccaceae bacterium]MDB9805623.1 aminoacyl-tRNA hydrolase [Porticoccaceae bacterium]MDB9970806.1 aminoacyl-tRNA hydrolase [Porticoccaceae bacterium]MDB9992810.1 aminoacyl-tRNA hydrolase [Porticoccaceae bacterium]MDC1453530.1 aminoacyl-tRNA hydrolase [Porticoccaceae bacterium]